MSHLKYKESDEFKELISALAIPKGTIALTEHDLFSMTTDMQSSLCFEIEGDEISQIEQQIDTAICTISSMPRNRCTLESIGYVLRCDPNLLWSEYQQIHIKLKGVSERNNLWFNYGIDQQKKHAKRIVLSIFYFTGEMDLSSNDDASFDVGEEFLAQVRAVNKNLH